MDKKEYQKQYNNSPIGREKNRLYYLSSKGKESKKKYGATPKAKEDRKKYRSTLKGEESKRNSRYRHLYKITVEEYQKILSDQGGVCFICKKVSRIRLAIDHNHKTGQVRGLLCRKCNVGLGLFEDNLDLLKSATNYLKLYENENSRLL